MLTESYDAAGVGRGCRPVLARSFDPFGHRHIRAYAVGSSAGTYASFRMSAGLRQVHRRGRVRTMGPFQSVSARAPNS